VAPPGPLPPPARHRPQPHPPPTDNLPELPPTGSVASIGRLWHAPATLETAEAESVFLSDTTEDDRRARQCRRSAVDHGRVTRNQPTSEFGSRDTDLISETRTVEQYVFQLDTRLTSSAPAKDAIARGRHAAVVILRRPALALHEMEAGSGVASGGRRRS